MWIFFAIIVFFGVVLLLLGVSAVLTGLLLSWLLPAVDLNTGLLAGAMVSLGAAYFGVQFMRALKAYDESDERNENRRLQERLLEELRGQGLDPDAAPAPTQRRKRRSSRYP